MGKTISLREEPDRREVDRRIWRLAWPAILRLAFMSTASLVTLGLVGTLGPQAIAAVGLGQRVIFIVIGVVMALTVGTTALVARYVGAENMPAARAVVAQSLLVGGFLAAGLAVLGELYGEKMIAGLMLGHPDAQVIALGGHYLRIIIFSMILGIPMMIINAAQQGAGDAKTPMYMVIGVNALTLVLGYLFIKGPGPFPSLGVTGAALGEGLARAGGGAVALALAFSGRFFTLNIRPREVFRLDPGLIGQILAIGLPASGEQMVRQGSQVIYTILIASLGSLTIAANQVAMAVQSISFMPGFGFGLAATTLVGQSLGAQKPGLAEFYGYETSRFAAAFMGAMGVVFFFWATPLVRLFTADPTVINLAGACVRIIAFAQLPFAVLMVLSGALRGAGDTRWVMYMVAAGEWGVRLILAYLLGFRLALGLPGVWLSFLISSFVLSGLVLWRYRSGRWKEVLRPRGSFQPQPSGGQAATRFRQDTDGL
ncbi:MAG: MATE family efflux transporter [Clostridia bacterium]|nr:MATE family efflux transporter [Clostridia bacterium]